MKTKLETQNQTSYNLEQNKHFLYFTFLFETFTSGRLNCKLNKAKLQIWKLFRP